MLVRTRRPRTAVRGRRPARITLVPVLALAVLAAACSGSKKPGGNHTATRTGNGNAGSPTTPPSSSGDGGGSVYPLGTVQQGGPSVGCLPGDQCTAFRVNCPITDQEVGGALDIVQPTGQPKGVVVFLSGGGGSKLWSEAAKEDEQFSGNQNATQNTNAAQMAGALLQALRDQGYMTIQVVWKISWADAPPGDPVGPAKLACRPATLLKFIHDTYYTPMNASPGPLACGFCLTGNSSGSSQIAYSMAFYGLSKMFDAVVETGGPPHAALDKACLGDPGYSYTPGLTSELDVSYGVFRPERGPCQTHDPSFVETWKKDGADTGGNDYNYPDTRVLLLLGANDATQVGPHQLAYFKKLQESGSPHVEQVTIPNMPHAITTSQDALDRIKNWFLSS